MFLRFIIPKNIVCVLYMPFLLFEQKSAPSLDIPALACNELITKITHDFPPYVHQLPCIYDVVNRKCHHGEDACIEFLAQFVPASVDCRCESECLRHV